MDSQYLIEQDPFFDTRERLIVEEYVLIHKKKLLKKIQISRQLFLKLVLLYYIVIVLLYYNFLVRSIGQY